MGVKVECDHLVTVYYYWYVNKEREWLGIVRCPLLLSGAEQCGPGERTGFLLLCSLAIRVKIAYKNLCQIVVRDMG